MFEVAVTTTTGLGLGFGAGTVGGAVKTAACPLAVWSGETEPQGALEQLTDQVTPEFVVSFVTSATTVAVAFVSIVLGGPGAKLIAREAVTVNEAEALKL
jgi:hypothetical protein